MIYWVKAGDIGAVKVGYAARDVAARMKMLQTGCPDPLILLRTEPGDRDLEAALHRFYGHKRRFGEWFALDETDVAVDLLTVPMRPPPVPASPQPISDADHGMQLIRSQRGMTARLTRGLDFTRGAISQWKRVPSGRLVAVERISGIPRQLLRPDLFRPPESDLQPPTSAALSVSGNASLTAAHNAEARR